MSSGNIFSALAKYNSAEDENYLTEAFAFVLNSLLVRERPIALEILTHLCVVNNEFSFDVNEGISVSTQVTTKQGTPDIKVSSPAKLIFIEVKDSSPVHPEQLKRYRKELESSSVAATNLILLTRFPVDLDEHQRIPDKHVRWFEVYNWLEKARVQDPISVYLVESFKSFLEVKQMSIQKVGWEYINGVPAFNNLINMIEAAITGAQVPIDWKSAAWDSKGFTLGNKEFWCGVHYNNPLVALFQILDKTKFDRKFVEKPTYEAREGKERLWFRLPLEEIQFFSLDKDGQLEEITKFVKTAHKEAQKMRISQ